jgi:cytochrome P450
MLSIPRDTNVIVGILPFNRNPKVWGEDAHLWKPERWMNLPDTVQDNNRAGIYANT